MGTEQGHAEGHALDSFPVFLENLLVLFWDAGLDKRQLVPQPPVRINGPLLSSSVLETWDSCTFWDDIPIQ